MLRDPHIDDEYGPDNGEDSDSSGSVDPYRRDGALVWSPGRLVYPGEVTVPRAENGFMYVATQPAAAYTGQAEPTWPTTVGASVVDGGVTWECRAKVSVTWTAIPLYKSGTVEPVWPSTYGGTVVDGTTTWTARTNAITDAKCPHTRTAIKMANKVFAPYRDVLRYCATDDPTDWSSANDAGFLPVGLHAQESPEPRALGEYRGRLAIWTASNLILWTVDPDPAEMALYDSIPGLGTVYDKGIVGVGNDLYYLTKQGIRSLSLSASSNNLGAGDVGSGIDPLVVAKLAGPDEPYATYYPGNGQAWFVFGNEVYVYTKSAIGKVGAWSRYVFPWALDCVTQLNGELYVRAGDNFYRLDPDATHDAGIEFDGVVWTPYLDMGSPGAIKQLIGVDVVAYGTFDLEVGYDQSNTALYTAPFTVGPDTVPGGMVPLPLAAPSLAFKLTFAGGQNWQLNAMTAYLQDWRLGA